MQFATTALEPFEFREAKHIFANSNNFRISDLGNFKTVLFLNTSDTDRTFDKFINIFYTQALQRLCSQAGNNPDGRLIVPVRFILDDFAASATIPDFDKIISIIRSRDISVSIILQSLTQLDSLYGAERATTIINNCDHMLYLGSQDLKTAQLISSRIFKTPEDVLCLPRDKAILVTNGERAKIVDKIPPYSTMEKEEPDNIPFTDSFEDDIIPF